MKQTFPTLLIFLLLAHSFGSLVTQRTRLKTNPFRNSKTARQLAPYPAAGFKPEVPFTLPTDQVKQLEEEDAATVEDLAEDVDPIAADAAEDDTELLPEQEARVSAKEDEEDDENADIIPERAAGPTPSKRYWFFRK